MSNAAQTMARGGKLVAYWELAKPRLSLFVLIVVFLSAWLAGGEAVVTITAVLGTGLVAAGASALNMLLERNNDARMARTWNRPLPSGRLSSVEVGTYGIVTALVGSTWLAVATTPLAAGLALATLISYIFLYTPLKTRTPLNTLVGAIPGALPALIGWAAVHGDVGPLPSLLFWIVFFWQLPHFLAIAWLYRDDYARGGYAMLPSVDPHGISTGRQAALGALTLMPIALLPYVAGLAGAFYAVGSIVLGVMFLVCALGFLRKRTDRSARILLRGSLIYLPLLMLLLFLDSKPL